MKHLLIGFLCLFCLAACKKNLNDIDPTFIVVTKEPQIAGTNGVYGRGAVISMDQIYMRERGFVWYSLTPPLPPQTVFKNRTSIGGGSQPGDFSTFIQFQSSVQDSFSIVAYAVTNNGDSLSGIPIKFRNY
jgi:hypothetical protein